MSRQYKILLSEETKTKIDTYKKKLLDNCNIKQIIMGERLQAQFNSDDPKAIATALKKMTREDFIEKLLNTKFYSINAEQTLPCPLWNNDEISILGDISFQVETMFYDNGARSKPTIHPDPIKGMLVYTPGALIKKGTPDYDTLCKTTNNSDQTQTDLKKEEFFKFYERRLLPAFKAANAFGETQDKQVILTIPGIGTGYFCQLEDEDDNDQFKDNLKKELSIVIDKILKMHSNSFKHIALVQLDLFEVYDEEFPEEKIMDCAGIKFAVTLSKYTKNTPHQLATPTTFAKVYGDQYKDCVVVSVVAADPIAFPGNDFWKNNRTSDEGTKTAPTDVMTKITGLLGKYDKKTNKYLYQIDGKTCPWRRIATQQNIRLSANGNIYVLSKGNELCLLKEDTSSKATPTSLAQSTLTTFTIPRATTNITESTKETMKEKEPAPDMRTPASST